MLISVLHNIGVKNILRIVLVIFLCVIFPYESFSQEQKLQNRPYIDLRPFHYGFMIGAHNSSLDIQNSGYIDPVTNEQWFAENSQFDTGFTVGLLGEWRLNSNFGVRILPTLHFATRHITFREQATNKKEFQEIRSTFVSLPVDIKFTPPRCNNYRPYFIVGVNGMYDLTTKKQDYLQMKPLTFMFEVGFGCDYYLPYFKFIPEIKYCFGLNNSVEKDRKALVNKSLEKYTKAIKGGITNMIVLTFYFE